MNFTISFNLKKFDMKITKIISSVFMIAMVAVLFFSLGHIADNFIGTHFLGYAFALVAIAMSLGIVPTEKGVLGANYTTSALVTGQAKLFDMFANAELRAIEPATYKWFRKQSEIMIPSHKVLRTREDRVLAAYYNVRTLRALGTGRNFNSAGVTGNSGLLTPSFTTWNDKFSISLKQGDDNVFGYDEMLANEMANVFKNFSEGNETNATNFLYNTRSAVSLAISEVNFNAGNNVNEINESTVGNRAILITDTAMVENRYGGMPLTIICDSVSYNKFAFLAKQGISNYTNTSFQFEGKTYVHAVFLTAKAIALGYSKGFWFAVPDGTAAVLDWIPKQNRTGIKMAQWEYATMINPIDDLSYAVFIWFIAQDSSAVGGYTQDILTNFEFSQDLSFEAAPLSVAGETTFQAFGLV